MKIITILMTLGLVIVGCSKPPPTTVSKLPFDLNKAGRLTWSNLCDGCGSGRVLSVWDVPADDVQAALKPLIPQDGKYKKGGITFVFGYTQATLEYDGQLIPISWSQLKAGGPDVLFFHIRGNSFVLEEPHSTNFWEIMDKHLHKTDLGRRNAPDVGPDSTNGEVAPRGAGGN